MPKVSIIIPTYNSEKFLDRAIKSVINQTYKNWELIIVDDFSTDKTREIIKNWEAKDKRICSIFLEKNSGGPAHPKNKGFEISQGEYIAYLDQDDEWLPQKLEKQLAIFTKYPNQKIGLVSCGANIVDDSGKLLMTINANGNNKSFSDMLIADYVTSNSSVLIPRKVIEEVGPRDESKNIGYYEDWDMWVRIMANGYMLKFVEEPLINYSIHANNFSRNADKLKRAQQNAAFYNKHKKLYQSNHIEHIILSRIGLFYALANQKKTAIEYYKKSIFCKKTYLVPYIGIVLACLGPSISRWATQFWHLLRGEMNTLKFQKIFNKL